ncbi:hypothetical protein OG432_06235 [Streptomyces sp. NBC_00442]|uniref:hypothetical protein n=1 Tax=Streptomyces sp. NBC_00442 TaxID=2903651 RepID=UPI002E1C9C8A
MSDLTDTLERLSPLWESPDAPTRWVLWHRATGVSRRPFETVIFDREFNIPYDGDDVDAADGRVLDEVIRRLREAGTPETDAYPGRPCG